MVMLEDLVVAHLVGVAVAQVAAADIPAEELVTVIVELQAAVAGPTAHPVRMRLVQQAYGRAMVKWSLPIALVSALSLFLL